MTMTKKIFHTILAVGMAVLVLSTALFCSVLIPHFTTRVFDELDAEARLAIQGVSLGGEAYLSGLDSPNRITWVASDGSVLFDSVVDSSTMENHLSRQEIQEALSTGYGQSRRYSNTLSTQTLYVALSLPDGSVLRVASEQSSVMALLLGLVPSLILVSALTAFLATALAYRLSRSISRPILALDLGHPEDCDTYEELTPLLRRIHSQNETIHAQMAALKQQHEEFTAITENMSEGFLLLDSRTNLLSCNTSALRLLGAKSVQQGESVLHLSRAEAFRQVVDESLAGQHSEALLEREGKCYQLLANCVMHEGQVAGAVIAILDVTERERREVLRREFTANVSHELKTPLTSISGFAELMKDGMVPPETVPEFAGDIYREAQRLITLVEDIIHLSQLDEDLVPMDKEAVDLHQLAADVVSRLAAAAEKAQVTLHLAGGSAPVDGVRHVLDEMLYNLADNAVKYNRPGGSVTVTTELADGHPRLTVKDTGIGIPAADRQRVFERFYRVDKSHSKEVGGTGLGLSIVKHAAAYHGAAVELESDEGAGTTITVIFPKPDANARP